MLIPRVEAKIAPEPNSGCWLWTGGLDRDGYGQLKVRRNGRAGSARAHRMVYELLVGPIPEGMTLDHKYRVRSCVNPAHLEPVSNKENILRGDGPAARNAAKILCIRGHELSGLNLYLSRGRRYCRECKRLWKKG